jgi:hypothetical protein
MRLSPRQRRRKVERKLVPTRARNFELKVSAAHGKHHAMIPLLGILLGVVLIAVGFKVSGIQSSKRHV